MIDFRYHVVSIVAVFLALALGLFIGATSLRGKVGADITSRSDALFHQNQTLRSNNNGLKGQLDDANSFDNALAPYALQGRLAGESVVVISAPGVDGGIRTNVMKALATAGATVTADVRLQDALIDPQQDPFLGTLADKVAVPGRVLPTGSGGQRALALLADVLVAKPQLHAVSRLAATRVLSAFAAGKLISYSGDTPQPAGLAVLLAAPGPTGTDTTAATEQSQLLATFAGYLETAATGTVAAGPLSADTKGGLIDAVRSDHTLRATVSTVDGLELPSGVIATVLAIWEQTDGHSGSYGTGAGADAPVPSPSPS